MSIGGTADPQQLAILTRVLDERCKEIGLTKDDPEREALAYRVMTLFQQGVLSVDDLKRALSEER
jgi:hypothetical protein